MVMNAKQDKYNLPDNVAKRECVYRTVHGIEIQFSPPEMPAEPENKQAFATGMDPLVASFDAEHGVIDCVDETGAESFPASDPPANW
ncbi:hypothetical protein [Rubripirellula reticaptiva]|uniref:Uncharacterized protein n=1 Tax=Rubripirellula reticaptiva TaxID=2528013 RepID=A0A5C6EH17_9BACT|nr:hypothetical protein [Rubripirellula reticaptiva]TWU47011.1 hypothetical protein Poly59_59850 [Rubripirellula reticaptiva]